jgi:hypothetical protein
MSLTSLLFLMTRLFFYSSIIIDIDTHSIEQPMVELLLNNERLAEIIDCFYFEHHVHLKEMAPYWKGSMGGTVEDSLKLFTTLREKGIAAHYWP